jgi:hypothetical protein
MNLPSLALLGMWFNLSCGPNMALWSMLLGRYHTQLRMKPFSVEIVVLQMDLNGHAPESKFGSQEKLYTGQG